MAPPSASKRPRYGTRKLVEQVFRNTENAIGLKTSELVAKVQSASGEGSKIPGATIFQAARTLVKRKVLEAKRDGREFRFKLAAKIAPSAGEPSPASVHGASKSDAASAELMAGGVPSSSAVVVPAPAVGSSPAHCLDPGQMLVLRHDEKEVVILTNVHGKAVIERHPL